MSSKHEHIWCPYWQGCLKISKIVHMWPLRFDSPLNISEVNDADDILGDLSGARVLAGIYNYMQ